ncbi:MAG: pyrimidine dimer DNA glycosylase/endonuclease V, partial [Bifidobacterium crudilactis]|nr:pyrimidine dimer DNA glycosylase/endonuclease V [Bifidobacterium crudilactis]
MRMWSLTPAVLDAKGIVACWRESLLAQAVLAGKTKGYTHHPQLERFRACEHPLAAVASYLEPLADEADRRGYHFDRSRILERPD